MRKSLLVVGGLALGVAHNAISASAVAVAEGSSGEYVYSVSIEKDTVDEAKRDAGGLCRERILQSGGNGKCTIAIAKPGPGYLAVHTTSYGKAPSIGFGFAADKESATRQAYQQCSAGGKFECSTVADFMRYDGGAKHLPEPPQHAPRAVSTVQQSTATPSSLEERGRAQNCEKFQGGYTASRRAQPGTPLYEALYGGCNK